MLASLAAGLIAAAPLPMDCGLSHADGGAAPRGAVRPRLSGETLTADSPDGFFRVHWTHEGDDAIGRDDFDGSGLPDVVDRTLDGLLEGRDLFAGLGYRDLIPDLGEEGTTALDVYIRDITAFGFAHAVEAAPEGPSHSCFMELDNALDAQGDGVLESVAVHELHHCTQYTYTPFSHDWLYEATATYEQYRDRRNGTLDAAVEFMWAFRLRDHARAVHATGERFEYAGFVFLKFWEEFGAGGSVPAIWEALREEPVWDEGLDTASRAAFDQSFDRTFRDFATWNLFACARADGLHYDPTTFPCTLPATSVPVEPIPAGEFELVHGEVSHTATFHELDAGGDARPAELRCDGPGDDAQVRMRLIALSAAGARGEAADASAEGDEGVVLRLLDAVDPDGRIALVTASTGAEPAALTCAVGRVEPVPEEEAGCECNNGAAPVRSDAAWILGLLLVLRGRSRASRASSSR